MGATDPHIGSDPATLRGRRRRGPGPPGCAGQRRGSRGDLPRGRRRSEGDGPGRGGRRVGHLEPADRPRSRFCGSRRRSAPVPVPRRSRHTDPCGGRYPDRMSLGPVDGGTPALAGGTGGSRRRGARRGAKLVGKAARNTDRVPGSGAGRHDRQLHRPRPGGPGPRRSDVPLCPGQPALARGAQARRHAGPRAPDRRGLPRCHGGLGGPLPTVSRRGKLSQRRGGGEGRRGKSLLDPRGNRALARPWRRCDRRADPAARHDRTDDLGARDPAVRPAAVPCRRDRGHGRVRLGRRHGAHHAAGPHRAVFRCQLEGSPQFR